MDDNGILYSSDVMYLSASRKRARGGDDEDGRVLRYRRTRKSEKKKTKNVIKLRNFFYSWTTTMQLLWCKVSVRVISREIHVAKLNETVFKSEMKKDGSQGRRHRWNLNGGTV